MATKRKTATKATKAKKKTTTAKKTTTKVNPATVKPVRQTMTKSALVTMLAEQSNISRKQANDVMNTLEGVMMGSVHRNGSGQFILPGIMKVTLRKVPARKAGTLIRNPATGEMMKAAAKPASVRVKIRPLSKLKKAATA